MRIHTLAAAALIVGCDCREASHDQPLARFAIDDSSVARQGAGRTPYERCARALRSTTGLDMASIAPRDAEAFFRKLRMNSFAVSLSGRNLWLIYSAVPNIDPEASYTNGNGKGVEYATYPILRSIGLNLKATF